MDTTIRILILVFLSAIYVALHLLKKKISQPRYIKSKDFFQMSNGEAFLSTTGKEPFEITHHYSYAKSMLADKSEENQ